MLYSIFGLTISVEQQLLGLTAVPFGTNPPIDIRIELGSSGPGGALTAGAKCFYSSALNDHDGPAGLTAWRLADGEYFRLLYQDGTSFVIDRQGENIWADWQPPLTLEDTAVYVLGPVLTFVLRLRGCLSLHAASVSVGGKAIALLGPEGAGKSTAAAIFATMGYPILTEDTSALVEDGDDFLVYPGYTLVRLWEDSTRALFGSTEALPRLTPTWEKRYLDLNAEEYRFESQTLPLGAIYTIAGRASDATALTVEELGGGAALMALIANTKGHHLFEGQLRSNELELLSRVASTVPIRQVVPHADPAQAKRLCEVILSDFSEISSARPVRNRRIAAH